MVDKTYTFHNHRYSFRRRFSHMHDCVKAALDSMGYKEVADSSNLNIYNHTAVSLESGLKPNPIFLKPTGPSSLHFSIDREGYASSSSLAFNRPDYNTVVDWSVIETQINERVNKWDAKGGVVSGPNWSEASSVKANHILVVGQMPTDETVLRFSFGDHIAKLDAIISNLAGRNVVVKLHPTFKAQNKPQAALIESWKGLCDVRTGFESIHSILPKTKVAIIENSTTGIECLMHDVPVISYGHPEYHWVTKDMRSLTQLVPSIDDMSWWSKEDARMFCYWLLTEHWPTDIATAKARLEQIL